MNWAVGVTTAPRPKSTVERTLVSLEGAGFGGCHVFCDRDKEGAWPNWGRALRTLVREHHGADGLLVCQDDAVFCRGLREYLDQTLWPAGNVALCSPYCPGPFRCETRGWHSKQFGWGLVGAVCWAIPYFSAEAMLPDLSLIEDTRRIDAHVGKWAAETGRAVYFHTPSLVQHIGDRNSAIGLPSSKYWRLAADFIGEGTSP